MQKVTIDNLLVPPSFILNLLVLHRVFCMTGDMLLNNAVLVFKASHLVASLDGMLDM